MRLSKCAGLPAVAFLFIGLSACSSLPDVTLKDRMADERTRDLAGRSAQVVKSEHALNYTDPAWPAPIQIVAPRKENRVLPGASRLSGEYELHLFQGSGSAGRIERVYMSTGSERACRVAIEQLGLPQAEGRTAYVRVGGGGGSVFYCGSTVIESDTGDLTFRNPFISGFYPVDLTHLGSRESLDDLLRQHPVEIRYLDQ